jgi:purine-binding chemotaxis protein CheW
MNMETSHNSKPMELTSFFVGDLLCGIENARIREISNIRTITPVHHAPAEVSGVVNLRGQIMTVIDMGIRFGKGPVEMGRHTRILVVNDGQEDIGLMVDAVEDVVSASREELEQPPSNVAGTSGHLFQSILKIQDDLISIIELDRLLKIN